VAGEGARTEARGSASAVPAALSRFDVWTADAAIANGVITLERNQVLRGARRAEIAATVTLSDSPKVVFAAPKEAQAARR
jgi:hypothetical protein